MARRELSPAGGCKTISTAKKLSGLRFIALILTALFVKGAALGQGQPVAETPRPKVSRVSPNRVSPAVYVSIEGRWLSAGDDSDAHIFFLQGGAEYRAESFGVGTVDADPDGLQYTEAQVPAELAPGSCRIVVEVKGRRSDPFQVEIVSTITPPALTAVRPRWAQPGESLSVEGTGFSGSDTVEITDASGRTREVDSSKHAETVGLPLPSDLPEGTATLSVVERRSGSNRRSNGVSFVVSRGPVPLHILPEWLRPAAPGQSLYLAAASLRPLEQATRLQVTLTQRGASGTTLITNLKDLRLTIPRTMLAGEVGIRNRVWRGRVASAWSEPVIYKISARPATPLVHNIQVWPRGSEAAFIQDGKEVAVRPIMLDGYPRVKVPGNLKRGAVVVERRLRRAGRGGQRPPESYSYNCCPLDKADDGVLRLYALEEWIFPVRGRPQTVWTSPGDVLVIEGDFFARRGSDLRVVLTCGGLRSSLKPAVVDSMQWASVEIPRPSKRGGDVCLVTVRNVVSRTESTLPVSLRIYEN